MAEMTRHDITQLLSRITGGDQHAANELLPLVYEELRKLARVRMNGESPDHTLQPTALVHEAYLRLVGTEDRKKWDGRGHFFASAAMAMRRILVERARYHARLKRGGDRRRIDLSDDVAAVDIDATDLLSLDEALNKLTTYDQRKAEIVMLRYFAGLTIEETASALGLSSATIKNEWAFARAWLHREMTRGGQEPREAAG
ncbi:MAG: sigma-70 family RNA polymerase sigma factor [Phycisphaeraceae bacterium]|nr:sigma-70 family RNA polymerase sigma factor [Phycisphaeraceae bacterium]MCW5753404.1 sigma-70 family RNA polymerase sigma factor [Phycisphaeraceae bacterium]